MSERVRLTERQVDPHFASDLLHWVTRQGADSEHQAAILVYHRIVDGPRSALNVPPWRFRQQMNFLRLHFRVVPLSGLIATLRHGGEFTAPTVAITFDDGYRDNLTEAAPVLAEFGLPATLFVAPGPQELGEPFWWDTLALAGITDPEILGRLKQRPHAEFIQAIEVARKQVGPARLAETVRELYLTWDELRRWAALGHEVGAHTMTHPIMPQVSPAQAAG